MSSGRAQNKISMDCECMLKSGLSPFAYASILHACVTDMGLVIGFRCHSSSFEKAASTYVYFGGKRIACRPTCSGWRSVKLAVTKFRHCFLENSLQFPSKNLSTHLLTSSSSQSLKLVMFQRASFLIEQSLVVA